MAKPQNKNSQIIGIVAALFGIVAFAMLFLPAVNNSLSGRTLLGYEVAFGKRYTLYEYPFNFLAVLAYFLPLVGVLFSFVGGKIGKILAFVAFAAAAVLLFVMLEYLSFHDVIAHSTQKAADFGAKLQFGPYVAGSFSAAAALFSVVGIVA